VTASLEPLVRIAQESARSLERSLADSRSHWDDATRGTFDRRYIDSVVGVGRKSADELAQLAQELAAALASLPT
jgi:hypothetical protein